MKLSNGIYIHFALEKEIGKIAILKKHTETLRPILLSVSVRKSNLKFCATTSTETQTKYQKFRYLSLRL